MDGGSQPVKSKKTIYIIIIAAIVCVLVVTGVVVYVLNKNKPEQNKSSIGVDSNIILDEESASKAAAEKVNTGSINLRMQAVATSSNGSEFTCYLCNSEKNTYDMFITIMHADTQEEVYRSGILPVGSRIESFKTNAKLESGAHKMIIVFNQVEEDQQTVHATTSVEYTLNVSD